MDITEIEFALRRPLPGRKAQYLMAPIYRQEYELADALKFNPRIGGVLLLLEPVDHDFNIILTLRKTYEGTHSGQMSFPGGRQEPGDPDIIETALRETSEEIGVPPQAIQVIGKLTELYIPPSNFLVYPSVGFLKEQVIFKKQDNEVEEIVRIPLSFFLDTKSRSATTIKLTNKTEIDVPAYIYGGYTIWGATAIIISEFVYLLESDYNANIA